MVSPTKQSTSEMKWVLNRIQTGRALDSRSGKNVVTFYYGNQNDDPQALEQYNILQSLSDAGAIKVLDELYDHIVSAKNRERVKIAEGASLVGPSQKTIFPSSIIIKIIEDKFHSFLSKFDIIADEDCVEYKFNYDKLKGELIVGEKSITFSSNTSIVLQYFYKNKSLKNNESDFETYSKYLVNSTHEEIRNAKALDSKQFRTIINQINKRVKKEIRNINEIISKTNGDEINSRNQYKWKIEFENI